jgi:ribonuclease III
MRSTTSWQSLEPADLDGPGIDRVQETVALAERLGGRGQDLPLLQLALTHRSWCAEVVGEESNERLEFLGDAVLQMVVTDHIYRSYPGLPEGELAKVRASVVNAASLAQVAASLMLGEALRLGKGEDASGGRQKPSILADALEAVIGAVYLDRGMDVAGDLVMGLLGAAISEAAAGPGGRDYKTRLQELAAQRFGELPCYTVTAEGPDHAKRFFARVRIADHEWGEGDGRSKKQAEQEAAKAAWTVLADAARPDGVGPEAADQVRDGGPGE